MVDINWRMLVQLLMILEYEFQKHFDQRKLTGTITLNFKGIIYILALWVECSSLVRETWVQSQVTSYQRHKKWYLIPSCLTLTNIRYVWMVKWSNPRKGVAPSTTPRCRSYWKRKPSGHPRLRLPTLLIYILTAYDLYGFC